MKTLQTIEYAEAQRIVDAIAAKLVELKKAAVIAVADPHGELLALGRLDGAPLPSIRIAINKAWSAARERKSTKEIGEKSRHPEKGFDIAYFGDPQFVGWGGGIPLWRNGQVVGSIAVSGLSSEEDIELAMMGAAFVEGS
ncbi:MAG TPA: heme-binding protein [Bryobacteraceae bacterium]|nr:heme-binding protein [Bryobacteraceae bacterium]